MHSTTPHLISPAVRRLWLDAFRANSVFIEMHRLYPQGQRISLNGAIVCAATGQRAAPLGVAMTAVATMTQNLAEIVAEVEGLFGVVVDAVATWIQIAEQQNSYLRALAHLDALPETAASTSLRQQLLRVLKRDESELELLVAALSDSSWKLVWHAERLEWVAARQTAYLSTLVAIESARLSTARADLGDIPARLSELRDDIGNASVAAHARVSSFAAALEVYRTTQTQRDAA